MAVSIRDIARLAGVSPATVSRVLNDPGHRTSTPEVRDRIWKVAREQNYIPNRSAQQLKSKAIADPSSVTLVDVLMTRSGKQEPNPFFNELFRNVEHELRQHAGIVSNVWYETALADARKARRVTLERVLAPGEEGRGRALVVIGRCERNVLGDLAERYGAVVVINRSTCDFAVDEVTCDGARIARISVEYLVGLGHRRIGYAGTCSLEPRYQGFQDALTRRGLTLDPSCIVECGLSEAAGRAVVDEFTRMDDPPTAVVCGTDLLALGMMRQLSLQGHRYWRPSIIGCDDIEEGQLVSPMLTTVGMSRADMAHLACDLLFDRLDGGHRDPVRVEVPSKLVIRESCSRVSPSDVIEYII